MKVPWIQTIVATMIVLAIDTSYAGIMMGPGVKPAPGPKPVDVPIPTGVKPPNAPGSAKKPLSVPKVDVPIPPGPAVGSLPVAPEPPIGVPIPGALPVAPVLPIGVPLPDAPAPRPKQPTGVQPPVILPPLPPLEPIRPPMPTTTNTYMALVPSSIRPGTMLRVPIRFLTTPATEQVTVTLMDRDNVTIATTTDVADGLSSITPELLVPGSVGGGSYRVEVVGTGSLPFKNSTSVWASWKALAIFVQTDKATYKPGDTVQYRVFVVNSSLDILEPTLNIDFKDPKGNKIAERSRVSSKYGIVGELPLSDMPPLGEWSITVEAPDFKDSKTHYNFGVEEYVLPKFEITVSLPPYATEDMPSLIGKVKAAYTFGKPVTGTLRLTVSKRYSSGFFDARAIVLEKPIDGEVSFDIPTTTLKRISRNLRYDSLMVHANVTELITGITLAGQADVRFHENPYKLEFFQNLPDYFKTSFNPYQVLLKVVQQDNRPPVVMPTDQVAITVTYYTDVPIQGPVPEAFDVGELDVLSPFRLGDTVIMNTVHYPLEADGTVTFDLEIPESAATATIKAEFRGLSAYKELKRFRSPGATFLQVDLKNAVDLKIRDVAVVELLSTEGPVTAQFIVLGKGQIVATGDIKAETPIQGQYMGTGAFAVTREMAPSARLVAFYVRPDGEIVADGLNFVVRDYFENQVTIAVDQSAPAPGQTPSVLPQTDVNYRVTAESDSLVYLLGVDQSVLLKRTGNDITQSRVTDELRRFGNSPWIGFGWGARSFRPWPIMADDVSDIFRAAQLNVLTDANLHKFNLWSINQRRTIGAGSMGGGRMFSAKSAPGMDNGGAPGAGAPSGFVRKDFPETWIWQSGPIMGGSLVVPARAPDTITTWVTNAFALSPTKGLGVASTQANLTVFLPFFVNLQLPYSVVRGEIAVIQANVFNYHPETLNVLVKLAGSAEFDGVSVDDQGNEITVTGDMQKCVQAISGKPVPVFFSVRPKIVGSMSVNVRISAQNAQRNVFDDVTRVLPVKAEGSPRDKNVATLFSFKTFGSETVPITISYPITVVPQSQKIRVTAIGDLFGPSLRNLDKLLKMPYGCGEQNMLNFAPAVFAAYYLQRTNRVANNAELIEKIKRVLRTGYQRELVYQRNNGSFSTFGSADDSGSLWLTAFVAKTFAQAYSLDLIYMDPEVVDKAVRYIVSYQQTNGSFINTGIVHHKAMQGGTVTNLRSLTAYVLIALQEVKKAQILTDLKTIDLVDNAILEASSLLMRERPRMTSDYERAIGAYALATVNSPLHTVLLSQLERSENRTVDGTRKYWKHPSAPLQIEIAGYALLTYSLTKDDQNGFPILNWLVKQGNGNGGFISTQDTVLALQGLSDFAALVYTDNVNLQLDFHTATAASANPKQSVTLNKNNHDVLQYKDFDGEVDTLTIEAKGTGLAVVDVNIIYNIYEDPEPPSYDLTLTVSEETKTKYTLTACARYNIPNSRSNMAIMDIGMVSGFEPVVDQVIRPPITKRMDLSAGRLVIYFDEIPAREVCVKVPMQRVSLVAGVKPANVIVYSYYQPNEKVLKNYLPAILNTKTLCDTCGAECGCPSSTPGTTAVQSLSLGACDPTTGPGTPPGQGTGDPGTGNQETGNQGRLDRYGGRQGGEGGPRRHEDTGREGRKGGKGRDGKKGGKGRDDKKGGKGRDDKKGGKGRDGKKDGRRGHDGRRGGGRKKSKRSATM